MQSTRLESVKSEMVKFWEAFVSIHCLPQDVPAYKPMSIEEARAQDRENIASYFRTAFGHYDKMVASDARKSDARKNSSGKD